jgi:hypothetical protein
MTKSTRNTGLLLISFGLALQLICNPSHSHSSSEVLAAGNPLTSTPNRRPPKLHSGGTFFVTYQGVSVPPAGPGEDGPYVFRAADLDEGTELPRTTEATDITVVVNARTLRVSLGTEAGVRAVEMGHALNHPSECAEILDEAKEPLKLANRQAPTGYMCLLTNEGRLCEFRVLYVRSRPVRPDRPNDQDVFVMLEYRTAEK